MIELAIRAAGRSGTPAVDQDLEQFQGNLDQAVNEYSAIGESASNGRAERTVQAVEDMLRTLKSALEARLRVRVPSTHPIMRWLVEHVATILNRYSVNKDGATPYFAFHGKRPSDRLVEFGEKVFYYVPRKARAKLDHRWKLGIFVGLSANSNESYVSSMKGNVIKARTIARVVEGNKWDAVAVMNTKGIPGALNPMGREVIDPSIEESAAPHLEGDAELRERAEHSLPAQAAPMEGLEEKRRAKMRKKITFKDLDKYGYSDNCRRCRDLQRGIQNPCKDHSDECRLRMYLAWKEAGDPKWNDVREIVEPGSAPPPPVSLDMDIERPEPVPPPTPTDDHDGRWDPTAFKENPEDAWNAPMGEYSPDDEDNDDSWMPAAEDFVPEPDAGNDDVSADAMTDALITAGTDAHAARLFTYAITKGEFPSSFMEIYGRGAIVKDANGPRRALNIQGLGALDIRTYKPNGDCWNFNLRADRNEARRLIDEQQPTWLIGSPPCTAFSIWNRNL